MSQDRKRVSIEKWVGMVLEEGFEDKPCNAIGLMHVSASGAQTEIKTIKIGQGREWTNAKLAEFVLDLANGYAQDLPGVQNFLLLAFFGSNEPKTRHPFILSGQLDNNGFGTEGPTNEGRLAQKMRHEEVLVQSMMAERAALLQMPLDMIRQMANYQSMLLGHMSTLQKENIDAVQGVKTMILEHAAKESQRQIEVLKYRDGAKLRDRLFTAAGFILNEATGKEIIPQGASDTILFDSIAENIPEKAWEEMMTTGKIPVDQIPPELLGMLMTRLKRALEKKRQLEEEAVSRGSEIDQDVEQDPSHQLTEGNGSVPTDKH